MLVWHQGNFDGVLELAREENERVVFVSSKSFPSVEMKKLLELFDLDVPS